MRGPGAGAPQPTGCSSGFRALRHPAAERHHGMPRVQGLGRNAIPLPSAITARRWFAGGGLYATRHAWAMLFNCRGRRKLWPFAADRPYIVLLLCLEVLCFLLVAGLLVRAGCASG